MAALDDADITAALNRLLAWSRDGDTLVKTYRCRNWTDAIAFVDRIAAEAERRNHHPDLAVTRYRNVTVRLTSHDERGITQRDIDLATWIESAAANPD